MTSAGSAKAAGAPRAVSRPARSTPAASRRGAESLARARHASRPHARYSCGILVQGDGPFSLLPSRVWY